ncbi:hypothetical protein CLOM_g11920 [Closterium sp. NIES-68]|nr:hypothetical protein CLOM_g11920 [Closterium sp. NIES-68]
MNGGDVRGRNEGVEDMGDGLKQRQGEVEGVVSQSNGLTSAGADASAVTAGVAGAAGAAGARDAGAGAVNQSGEAGPSIRVGEDLKAEEPAGDRSPGQGAVAASAGAGANASAGDGVGEFAPGVADDAGGDSDDMVEWDKDDGKGVLTVGMELGGETGVMDVQGAGMGAGVLEHVNKRKAEDVLASREKGGSSID